MASSLREMLLAYLDDHGGATTEELQRALGVSRRHIQRTLHELASENRVSRCLIPGSRHTGAYSLVYDKPATMQPVNRLLEAIEQVGGMVLQDQILQSFIDDYYKGRMDHSIEQINDDPSLQMSCRRTPNGWWITMQSCPFPYWRGTQSVCQAEERAFSRHLHGSAIHVGDAKAGTCQFFVPVRTDKSEPLDKESEDVERSE
jgi:predicted ArsR family transcriptional regulator